MAKRLNREMSVEAKLLWLLKAGIRYRHPPRGAPWEKSLIELIEDQRYNWETNKDPLAPWATVRLCKSGDIAYPRWLLEYFELVANQILEGVPKPFKRDTPVEVSKILAFDYGRSFSRWRVLNRNYHLFLRYRSLRLTGMNSGAAITKSASEFSFSAWSIRRYLNDFAHLFVTEGPDYLIAIQQQFDLDLEPHSRVVEPSYVHEHFRICEIRGTVLHRSPAPLVSTLTDREISVALDCEQLSITPPPKQELFTSHGVDLTLLEISSTEKPADWVQHYGLYQKNAPL